MMEKYKIQRIKSLCDNILIVGSLSEVQMTLITHMRLQPNVELYTVVNYRNLKTAIMNILLCTTLRFLVKQVQTMPAHTL